jgi:hypothetical protein
MIIAHALLILVIPKLDVYTQSLTAMITMLVLQTPVIAILDVSTQILLIHVIMMTNVILTAVILPKVVYLTP